MGTCNCKTLAELLGWQDRLEADEELEADADEESQADQAALLPELFCTQAVVPDCQSQQLATTDQLLEQARQPLGCTPLEEPQESQMQTRILEHQSARVGRKRGPATTTESLASTSGTR